MEPIHQFGVGGGATLGSGLWKNPKSFLREILSEKLVGARGGGGVVGTEMGGKGRELIRVCA